MYVVDFIVIKLFILLTFKLYFKLWINQDNKCVSENNVKSLSNDKKVETSTQEYPYVVNESTLETLPGTITPPNVIYSPKEKLNSSCITVTSTPTLSKDSNMQNHAMINLSTYLWKDAKTKVNKSKNVNFLLSNGTVIDGKCKPILNLPTKKQIEERQKNHKKILKKRKKLWQNYQRVKNISKTTNKFDITLKGLKFQIKKNQGDLI